MKTKCENKYCNKMASESWTGRYYCYIHYLLKQSKDKLEKNKK
jgi:hypothetical protein